MKIVLASAPHAQNAWNSESFPPLGLLYVAGGVSGLPNARVRIVDCFGEGLTVGEAAGRILAIEPDIVGLSITSRNLDEATALLTALKASRPGITTIAGGIHPTLFDTLMLQEIGALDFIIRGEGDESFGALCRSLAAQQPVAGIPGVSCRADGAVVSAQPAVVADLDALPFPDRSLLDFKRYASQWYGYDFPNLPPIATAISSRGCPYECVFCSDTKFCGRKYRTRSAANVVGELSLLAGQGYEMVIFWDDNFVADARRTEKMCRLILEKGLKLHLACAGTFHGISQPLMNLMHEAGFDLAFVGVESGSQAQLARYKKPVTRQAIAESIGRMKKAHIVSIASFINGAPGETAQDFEETKDFMREVRPHLADINPLMVHPGSGLWDSLNPPGKVNTLADTHSVPIWRHPGQHDRETVHKREKEFRTVVRQTLLNWRQIWTFFALLVYNPLVRTVFLRVLKQPGTVLGFAKGPKPR